MSAEVGRLAPPQEVVERALAAAPGVRLAVICVERFESEVRFAKNTATTNGVRRDRRLSVVAFDERAPGCAVGVASASGSIDGESLVAAAIADAKAAPLATDAAPFLDGDADADYGVGAEPSDFAVLRSICDALPDAFARATLEGHVLSGFARHESETVYLATTDGFRHRHVQPDGTLELVARSADGKRSAWAGVGTRDFSDVAFEELDHQLRERLAWARRSIELAPGRYEAILPPDAVADLMIPLEEAMSGRDAEDGQSVFATQNGGTRLGERLAPIPFVLSGDPHYPGLECAPRLVTGSSSADVSVFDNGSALGATRWIEDGSLARLHYHRAGAARSDAPFAPPIDNLILSADGASDDLAALIARSDRALLLTCLWYIREVDPTTLLLTGLTRDGVYLVEGGEVVGAVNNFRFNESPLDVLARASEVGVTTRALSREWNEWMSRTAMPALRVADFNMSSVSPAN